jgi:hypothetical protein
MPHQPDQSDFQFALPAIDVQGMPEDDMATRLTFPEGCSHRVYGADAAAARRSMGTVVGRSAREDISEVTRDGSNRAGRLGETGRQSGLLGRSRRRIGDIGAARMSTRMA